MTDLYDALIVGGGLAGGALAVELAQAGRRVVLFEREAGPHDKVCGEFLSREAVLYLEALGIDAAAMGAHSIHAVRLAIGDHIATADLPFAALSLSRRVLDEAVLECAGAAGAEIRRGNRVRSLGHEAGQWRAAVDGRDSAKAGAAFLATGKHDLRGWPRPAGLQGDLIGFKMHWRLATEEAANLAGIVELMLFPGGYAGLEPIEGGKANLCLVVRRSRFSEVGQSWPNLLSAICADSPLLRRRLDGAAACWERPLAVSSIPYGYVCGDGDGLWRLGDQAAVIPSFAGDGISIALHSARLAADCFLSGGDAALYQRQMARDVGVSVRLATLVSQAIVRPGWQAAIGLAVAAAPSLMAGLARATRIPASALRRAGLNAA